MGSYDITTNIIEHVTLFQLIYSLGNTNHSISVVGYWIANVVRTYGHTNTKKVT